MTGREGFAQAAHATGCISVLLHQLPEGSEYRKHYHLINNVDAAMYMKYEGTSTVSRAGNGYWLKISTSTSARA